MFTCGATNFSAMDQDDPPSSAPSTPKSKKQKPNKNPYAARGLDKFSMVLAELETKKEKIMEKVGSEGVAMVRFMCDNARDSWVPIIIRPPKDHAKTTTTSEVMIKNKVDASISSGTNEKVSSTEVKREESGTKERRRLVLRWRDVYYWPLVMVVILLCLVMFGRVFAICCTCIWWYTVPNCMSLDNNKERKGGYGVVKRKEMGRRLSDKRLGGNLVNVQVHGKKG